ncbi:MAG TPA: hypothetical protein VEH27_17655 [Methylomirabilota bacterium]|nr:hypothetical protein [Methylomirabilota bacterium]
MNNTLPFNFLGWSVDSETFLLTLGVVTAAVFASTIWLIVWAILRGRAQDDEHSPGQKA